MKIFGFKVGSKEFVVIKDCGELKPFTEASLLAQLLAADDGVEEVIDGYDQMWVVFSPSDEDQISNLSSKVVGDLEIDRGLGHKISGNNLLLTKLLDGTGLYVSAFPTNANVHKPVTDEEGWSLAIQSL